MSIAYNPPPLPRRQPGAGYDHAIDQAAEQVARSTPPVRVEVVEDRANNGQQAFQIITNAVVIITCLAVLYSLYAVYSALSQLGDNLRQVGL